MHPAPSLSEAPPSRDEPRQQGQQQPQQQQRPMSAGSAATDPGRTPSTPSSPHMRIDAASSASPTVTTVTSGSAAVATSSEVSGDPPPYSADADVSPTFATQAIFSARDGSDQNAIRRPSRRRTGPLSASQREKAALIRKLGACGDCRRRRVAVRISFFFFCFLILSLGFFSFSFFAFSRCLRSSSCPAEERSVCGLAEW